VGLSSRVPDTVRRVLSRAAATAVLALGLTASSPAAGPTTTFAAAGARALDTLLTVYYDGAGAWNDCNRPGCNHSSSDWGADSLTYALAMRSQAAGDASIPPVLAALTASAPTYRSPCGLPDCGSWSDNPLWDSIAASRAFGVTNDPAALAKAEAAFAFVESSRAFALGACPDIRYQQPAGRDNRLKTLETDANGIKAAILLYRATGDASYLTVATTRYAAVRNRFLDPAVPLYTVYVFDDGSMCSQVPHRFFASVNGDMIWNGLELSRITGEKGYLDQAVATARAVATA